MALNKIGHGIKTFWYAVQEESIASILKNTIRFLFKSNNYPYKIFENHQIIGQITHLYITPVKVEIDGWQNVKTGILNSVSLSINDIIIPLEKNISKPLIQKKYGFIKSELGFHGLISKEVQKEDLISLRFEIDGHVYVFPVEFELPRYISHSEIEKRNINPITITSNPINKESQISIIIPFKDRIGLLNKVLDSILQKTLYQNYEILLIDNRSSNSETKEFLDEVSSAHHHIRVIEADFPFNFSKIINCGVSNVNSEFIVLLNNDIEILSEGWLTTLMSLCNNDEVGCIGPRLLYEDQTIQHTGIVIPKEEPLYVFNHYPADFNLLSKNIMEYSAITGACIAMKTSVFEEVHGMDESLPVTLNDVDFCLKLRQKGYKIFVEPRIQMIHHKSVSRGNHDAAENIERTRNERKHFKNKWKNVLKEGDPFYPSNCSHKYPDYRIN